LPLRRPAALAVIVVLAVVAGAGAVAAHDLILTGGDFGNGYTVPLSSLAKLLGFVAIGLWSGQLGGRAVWQLPAVALASAAFAGVISEAGVVVPHTDQVLMAALVVVGILMVLATRLPLFSPWAVVAVVALFEGYPLAETMYHGPNLGSWAGYGTAALLAMAGGLGLGMMMPAPIAFRVFGIGIAAAGIAMLLDKI
jgi:urease accessory protein